MSGRLNPRDYDLGELRDAVRHAHQREQDAEGATDESQERSDEGTGADGSAGSSENGAEESSRSTDSGATAAGPTDAGPTDPESADDGARETSSESSRTRRRDHTVSVDRRSRGRRRDGTRNTEAGTRNTVGGQRSTEAGPRTTEAPPISSRDLERLAQVSRGGVERPYLARLPDGYRAQLEIFEWLEALLDTGGRDGALDALAYYESIGWLSERSHDHLVDFLDGLSPTDGTDSRPLTVEHHRQSLLYVARLAQRLH